MSEDVKNQDDARCQILRHAVELFSHYGYRKTNIGDIAKACCMSPGNLYRHFRNKQDIGEEAVREYMASEEADMAAIVQDTSLNYEARLRAFHHRCVKGLMDKLSCNPKMVELAEMIIQGNSGILTRHVEWKREQVAAMLREGIEAGEISGDPEKLAFTLYDMTKAFLAPPLLAQADFATVPDRLDDVLDLALGGMRIARQHAV